MLSGSIPELFSLKFLKKLNLANNRISELWQVPEQVENLNVSCNFITELNGGFLTLKRLQNLDISSNCIKGISELRGLSGLKCLYASSNKISSLEGLQGLSQLIELDLNHNLIEKREDLAILGANDSIVVVSIENNPVVELFITTRSGFAFTSIDEFPKGYSEITIGLYFRNPEKLRKLKSSRYRNIIKQYKSQEKYSSQLASPDWGYSKCYSSINYDIANDSLIGSFDEKDQVQGEKVLKTYFKELKDSDDELHGKKLISIAKLDLKKISTKISYEKSSTKPESNIEGLFEDLISYCQIEENSEKEFSFSNEKYEHAVNVLKIREDERKMLVGKNEILAKANTEMIEKYQKVEEERNELQQNLLQLRNDFKAQEELISKLITNQKIVRNKKENLSIPTENSEKSKDVEENYLKMNCSFESSFSSFSQLPETSIMSLDHPRSISNIEFLVDNKVGSYIKHLLKKISNLVSKNKTLKNANKDLKKHLRKAE